MSERGRGALKQLLADRYDALLARLTRRLGSAENARDALHDAYVRLDRAAVPDTPRQPIAYLLRMATNIASNTARQNRRLLGADEIEAILSLPDEAPDAERSLLARSELEIVETALATMPSRRRAIFVAAWIDLVPNDALARQHGIAMRTVQHEIKLAGDHIREMLGRPNILSLRAYRRRVS